jgi:hypothetical protein
MTCLLGISFRFLDLFSFFVLAYEVICLVSDDVSVCWVDYVRFYVSKHCSSLYHN